jgi:hypothetical protein
VLPYLVVVDKRIRQVKLALDQHAALNVSKTTLANAINKVPYSQNRYTGNPNVGFFGNMYTPTYFFEIRVSVIYATFAEVVFFIAFFAYIHMATIPDSPKVVWSRGLMLYI